MAPKIKTVYVCAECGAESPKWAGKCPACGCWNSLNEEVVRKETAAISAVSSKGMATAHRLHEITAESEHRYNTGI